MVYIVLAAASAAVAVSGSLSHPVTTTSGAVFAAVFFGLWAIVKIGQLIAKDIVEQLGE